MSPNFQGVTRILLVKIPYFKEVILSSFECENCGERNTEIQSGATVQQKGNRISLKVTSTNVNDCLFNSMCTCLLK